MEMRKHGYSTAVADNASCISTCALAWLGGVARYMGTNSRIGFHAPKASLDNAAVAPPEVHALIGAYLNRVAIDDFKVIMLLTMTPPTNVLILTQADTARYKIPVTPFSLSSPQWAWVRGAKLRIQSNDPIGAYGIAAQPH